VFLLWPFHAYRFRFDPRQLLGDYIDTDSPSSLSEMQRELALRVENDRESNWRIIRRLRIALQLALVLFLLEIVACLFAIVGG
jgi:hypothetical protein